MDEQPSERTLSGAALTRALQCHAPGSQPLVGTHVSLRAIQAAEDASVLYPLVHGDESKEALWDYLPYGPFTDVAQMSNWMQDCADGQDPHFYVIEDHQHGAVGMCSYLEIFPDHGTTEIGHIWFNPKLQRTVKATEAIYLMMHHAFEDLGNRRLQWKCNALNASSRRAAQRFGFRYEAIMYQHKIVKGCNRDTAYYSLMDHEWPAVNENFKRWLADTNFDSEGNQLSSLRTLNQSVNVPKT